jgi:hypothetical protein
VAISADRNATQKEAEKRLNARVYVKRDTTNVGHELCDFTRGNWRHGNGNERFKEIFLSYTGETFSTENSCTWNITHNTDRTASETRSLGGGHRRWVTRSTGEKWPVARDTNNNNNNNNNNT